MQAENAALKHQLDWFKRQLFGPKSEKRVFDDPQQLALGDILGGKRGAQPEAPKQTITYERGKANKKRGDDCVNDSGLRFDDTVPVRTITCPVLELNGLSADEYEIVDIKRSFRLAQRPASYEVLCYERPVVKLKATGKLATGISLMQVLDNTAADVSVVVGLLVDKFQFHLPLYRQHQRMAAAGITLSRATLTNWVQRAIMLLEPIVDAQRTHILRSKVLAMDETPIKAGLSKKRKGKMHQGYYWPLYGEDDEVVFTYSDSRARRVIEQILSQSFCGTLVSDGYAAYARYAQNNDRVTHAQCWVHTRRQFVDAEKDEPALVAHMLQQMQALYRHEEHIADNKLADADKREYRLMHSKPVVDTIFEWVQTQRQRIDLVPAAPFAKALGYIAAREDELRVFLADPDVPLDTNHLERIIRPIPMGRRNWLFAWTELGAQHVGIIQSLISTCRLHDVNPWVYLTDVLQRIQIHPDRDIIELTPRVWKTKFADDPMRSDLHLTDQQGK
ncbi:MAG: IS66 family transposase [Burkholderiaceae bacterium]